MNNNKISLIAFFGMSIMTYLYANSQDFNGSFESRFVRYQKGQAYIGEVSDSWDEIVWRGERVHKQIILWSNSTISDLRYQVEDLKGESGIISKSDVKIRFAGNVKGDEKALTCSQYAEGHSTNVEIADALMDREVNEIDSSDPLKLWITIDIPSNTKAGKYSGNLEISHISGSLAFSINLEVVDFKIPNVSEWSFHLDLWQFPLNFLHHHNRLNPDNIILPWSQDHYELIEPAYQLLADLGQKVITTYIKGGSLGAESMVQWIKKSDGTWSYDYTDFNTYVEFMFSLGINAQISCFSPVGWNEEKIPYYDEASNMPLDLYAPLNSPEYAERWDHFLTDFKNHLRSKGWFDKTVLYLDEVQEDKLHAVISVVKGNDSAWKLGIAYSHAIEKSIADEFYDLSGILEQASIYETDSDKIFTFYTSCSQKFPNSYVTPENNPAEMTWMSWHAFNGGYNGFLRWAFDYGLKNDPFDARDGAHTAGDFALVYRNPGDYPFSYSSSIRMELLREGIQDYEKINVLVDHLAKSEHPADLQVLNELRSVISRFGKTSGKYANSIIPEAQELLKQIVIGEYGYCKTEAGQDKGYYIVGLRTVGGEDNISISVDSFPSYGYSYHTQNLVSGKPGDTLEVELKVSESGTCARVIGWIDWNNDKDFEEEEHIFDSGSIINCGNSDIYRFNLKIPQYVRQGIKRVRFRLTDSTDFTPIPCGLLERSSVLDFDLSVIDPYCGFIGDGYEEYFIAGLQTSGGKEDHNINYNPYAYPSNGFGVNINNTLVVEKGDIFSIYLENSPPSKCARTLIWIDWNADLDFDDNGELIFDDHNTESCENPVSKTINVKVPSDILKENVRMRVILRDSWLDPPKPCGTASYSAGADFYIQVINAPTTNIKEENLSSSMVYPNPTRNGIIMVSVKEGTLTPYFIEIFNSNGKKMLREEHHQYQKYHSINLSNLGNGLYFVKIVNDSQTITRKLVVQKGL
ncbi:MAG: GEVED domain-containing protein [Cytophagales bacterium]|nr:GEVED domain-containing protein [Cytophagales bacterium]